MSGSEPGPRVLVVDDDDAITTLVSQHLRHDGYRCVVANSGAEALEVLASQAVDLVILDVRMPGIDGLEVCRRLRADPKHARLPVIFLTADTFDETREAASLEAGGNEYLLKPVSRRVLTLRVRNLLRLASAEREQQLLAQVAHAEKLAGIGQVAAGVAHEINNPLAFVLANLGTLGHYFDDVQAVLAAWRRSPEEGRAAEAAVNLPHVLEDLRPLLDETKDGAERVRRIVQELKIFSRAGDGQLEPVDLADVARSTLLLTERELSSSARVIKELLPARLEQASRGRLHQVVLNLIINALHACRARALPEGARHCITVRTGLINGAAFLSVTDTGEGIPAAQRPRVFEPFFSTKPVGVGAGLGLAVCAAVASQLGGTVEVESTEGEGSTFTLRLPVDAVPVAEEPPPSTPAVRA
ncbi:MAG: sensor histidine kinase [Myxococcota bacterium]